MKTRLATVKYANSLPFQYGLELLSKEQNLMWIEATPSECNELFKKDEVDIALLPIGAAADWDQLYLASNYCIACNGPVGTVVILSDYPKNEIKQIVFDSASRTSNLLVQIIVRDYWNIDEMRFVGKQDAQSNLPTAYVSIGDQVFEQIKRYKYSFDLGEQWKNWTGMPFVFAVWVSKKPLSAEFRNKLDFCFSEGIKSIPFLLKEQHHFDNALLRGYFEKNISFELDQKKMEAIDHFLQCLKIKNPFMIA